MSAARRRLVPAACFVVAMAALPASGALAQSGVQSGVRSPAINGSGQTQNLRCNGGDALVNGSSNRLVFSGPCSSLRVNGTDNLIEIELVAGAPVAIAGNGNHVLYAATGDGSGPSVAMQGSGNMVDANDQPATATLGGTLPSAPPQAPSLLMRPVGRQPGAIVLDGDGQTRSADCNGRDVLIHGSGGSYALTGGCRSVTVEGSSDRIQAELQPGARVAVGGTAVTLSYTLTADGPAPVVSVTGSNSVATHVQNFSDESVTLPPGSAVIGAPVH